MTIFPLKSFLAMNRPMTMPRIKTMIRAMNATLKDSSTGVRNSWAETLLENKTIFIEDLTGFFTLHELEESKLRRFIIRIVHHAERIHDL